jgi:hypothetical protein
MNNRIYDQQTESRVEAIYHAFFEPHITPLEYMNRVIKPHGELNSLMKWINEEEQKMNLIIAAEIIGLLRID